MQAGPSRDNPTLALPPPPPPPPMPNPTFFNISWRRYYRLLDGCRSYVSDSVIMSHNQQLDERVKMGLCIFRTRHEEEVKNFLAHYHNSPSNMFTILKKDIHASNPIIADSVKDTVMVLKDETINCISLLLNLNKRETLEVVNCSVVNSSRSSVFFTDSEEMMKKAALEIYEYFCMEKIFFIECIMVTLKLVFGADGGLIKEKLSPIVQLWNLKELYALYLKELWEIFRELPPTEECNGPMGNEVCHIWENFTMVIRGKILQLLILLMEFDQGKDSAVSWDEIKSFTLNFSTFALWARDSHFGMMFQNPYNYYKTSEMQIYCMHLSVVHATQLLNILRSSEYFLEYAKSWKENFCKHDKVFKDIFKHLWTEYAEAAYPVTLAWNLIKCKLGQETLKYDFRVSKCFDETFDFWKGFVVIFHSDIMAECLIKDVFIKITYDMIQFLYGLSGTLVLAHNMGTLSKVMACLNYTRDLEDFVLVIMKKYLKNSPKDFLSIASVIHYGGHVLAGNLIKDFFIQMYENSPVPLDIDLKAILYKDWSSNLWDDGIILSVGYKILYKTYTTISDDLLLSQIKCYCNYAIQYMYAERYPEIAFNRFSSMTVTIIHRLLNENEEANPTRMEIIAHCLTFQKWMLDRTYLFEIPNASDIFGVIPWSFVNMVRKERDYSYKLSNLYNWIMKYEKQWGKFSVSVAYLEYIQSLHHSINNSVKLPKTYICYILAGMDIALDMFVGMNEIIAINCEKLDMEEGFASMHGAIFKTLIAILEPFTAPRICGKEYEEFVYDTSTSTNRSLQPTLFYVANCCVKRILAGRLCQYFFKYGFIECEDFIAGIMNNSPYWKMGSGDLFYARTNLALSLCCMILEFCACNKINMDRFFSQDPYLNIKFFMCALAYKYSPHGEKLALMSMQCVSNILKIFPRAFDDVRMNSKHARKEFMTPFLMNTEYTVEFKACVLHFITYCVKCASTMRDPLLNMEEICKGLLAKKFDRKIKSIVPIIHYFLCPILRKSRPKYSILTSAALHFLVEIWRMNFTQIKEYLLMEETFWPIVFKFLLNSPKEPNTPVPGQYFVLEILAAEMRIKNVEQNHQDGRFDELMVSFLNSNRMHIWMKNNFPVMSPSSRKIGQEELGEKEIEFISNVAYTKACTNFLILSVRYYGTRIGESHSCILVKNVMLVVKILCQKNQILNKECSYFMVACVEVLKHCSQETLQIEWENRLEHFDNIMTFMMNSKSYADTSLDSIHAVQFTCSTLYILLEHVNDMNESRILILAKRFTTMLWLELKRFDRPFSQKKSEALDHIFPNIVCALSHIVRNLSHTSLRTFNTQHGMVPVLLKLARISFALDPFSRTMKVILHVLQHAVCKKAACDAFAIWELVKDFCPVYGLSFFKDVDIKFLYAALINDNGDICVSITGILASLIQNYREIGSEVKRGIVSMVGFMKASLPLVQPHFRFTNILFEICLIFLEKAHFIGVANFESLHGFVVEIEKHFVKVVNFLLEKDSTSIANGNLEEYNLWLENHRNMEIMESQATAVDAMELLQTIIQLLCRTIPHPRNIISGGNGSQDSGAYFVRPITPILTCFMAGGRPYYTPSPNIVPSILDYLKKEINETPDVLDDLNFNSLNLLLYRINLGVVSLARNANSPDELQTVKEDLRLSALTYSQLVDGYKKITESMIHDDEDRVNGESLPLENPFEDEKPGDLNFWNEIFAVESKTAAAQTTSKQDISSSRLISASKYAEELKKCVIPKSVEQIVAKLDSNINAADICGQLYEKLLIENAERNA